MLLEISAGVMALRTADFDYQLPQELIAQHPAQRRDHSRLMVLSKEGDTEHSHFYQLPQYLKSGDLLVLNNTRVLPARLFGQRQDTGSSVELVLLHPVGEDQWEALVRPGKKAKPGVTLAFGDLLQGTILSTTESGGRIIQFHYEGSWDRLLEKLGEVPLPPYIHEKLEDPGRYQTVYAKEEGSAAAPTAGLHFTPELLGELAEAGVGIEYITLHVGLGTFRPVRSEQVAEHQMHAEYFQVSQETVAAISDCKRRGKRVIAVGTTTVRALESAARGGELAATSGWTDIFLYPPYKLRTVDGLITNFHFPRSTLLMLVSCLVPRERLLQAYRVAVERKYRFYSFGDAMLII